MKWPLSPARLLW